MTSCGTEQTVDDRPARAERLLIDLLTRMSLHVLQASDRSSLLAEGGELNSEDRVRALSQSDPPR